MPAPFAFVGEEITGTLPLTEASIAAFATACGDQNPLHHDLAAARASRFGGLIACGPQVTSIFMALTATHFSRKGAALGLEFGFQLRKAARAGDTLRLAWRVVRVEPKPRLAGEIVFLEGEVLDPAGEVLVAGKGTLLVAERL